MVTRPAQPLPGADPLWEERYRAMSSRDARFDGTFITGVHSTGIYCRPSCPAITPKRANVSFYLTAAAAHEAGLRACKRCLPDAVPGSPEWNVRDDLAARAMRLIGDGEVERVGVPGLAARLGYTSRHLGRVLQSELGAGPLALARAHRAQTARELLIGTELSITDIAFAAGFGSIRQFNETISAVYTQTPGEIRARALARRSPVTERAENGRAGGTDTPPSYPQATALTLRLPARSPFDGGGVHAFLAARSLPGVEVADGGSYVRAVRLPHGIADLRLTAYGGDSPGVECNAMLHDLADLAPLVARVRRLFDLDADAAAIDGTLAGDPVLAPRIAAAPGIRLPGTLDAEETLFRALIGQQVSVTAARTALTRLADALGERHGAWTLFPTAAAIAEHGEQVLRGPAARVRAIVGAASALATGQLRLDVGASLEEFTSALVALPGIGPWTAGYLAMRVLGTPDLLLTSDLAMRNGAARLALPVTARELADRGAAWAPWRSYAGMHLWRAASAPPPAECVAR